MHEELARIDCAWHPHVVRTAPLGHPSSPANASRYLAPAPKRGRTGEDTAPAPSTHGASATSARRGQEVMPTQGPLEIMALPRA
jgi:hypothetical protein